MLAQAKQPTLSVNALQDYLADLRQSAWGPGTRGELDTLKDKHKQEPSRILARAKLSEREHAQHTLLTLDDFFYGVVVTAAARTDGSAFRLRTRKIWDANDSQ
jgi:hypothetical protein